MDPPAPIRRTPPSPGAPQVVFFIILLFWLFAGPNDQNGQINGGFGQYKDGKVTSLQDLWKERIQVLRGQLDVLRNETYVPPTSAESQYALNLTGFREHDAYALSLLDDVKERARKIVENAIGIDSRSISRRDLNAGRIPISANVKKEYAPKSFYQNATGTARGTWVQSKKFNQRVEEVLRHTREKGVNLTELAPDTNWSGLDVKRNITGREGKMRIAIEDDGREISGTWNNMTGSVRRTAVTLTIQDESSNGNGWEMRLHGVHWPHSGSMIMTSTSNKFAGIFALPHFTLTPNGFASSQDILNKTLTKVVDTMEKNPWTSLRNPWTTTPDVQSDDAIPVPNCEYIVYIQLHPVSLSQDPTLAPKRVEELERELRFPNGLPEPEIPPLKMSLLAFSPDCGFILESKGPPDYAPQEGTHLEGLKQESYASLVKYWSLIKTLVVFAQMLFTKLQMQSGTPSTTSRISVYMAGMLVAADSLFFVSFSVLAATTPMIFPTGHLVAFASMLSVVFGGRFLVEVWKVQEPERRERQRAREAAEAAANPPQDPALETSVPSAVITPAGVDSAPIRSSTAPPPPTTTPRPTPVDNTPIIIPSDQDIDAEIAEVTNAAAAVPLLPTTNGQTTPRTSSPTSDFASIYARFILSLFLLFVITLHSTSWPISLRTAYTYLLSFIYLSFLVPQIYRNILRNCRKALLWEYVIAQSVLRVSPFVYFWWDRDNVIWSERSGIAVSVALGWVWCQVLVLIVQWVWDPRLGLERFAFVRNLIPKAWDYHPILRESDMESGGLPIGLVKSSESTVEISDHHHHRKKNSITSTASENWCVDCAICMQSIEVPVLKGDESENAGGVVGMLARRLYMVTPCRHVFHSGCLEGWLRFKLRCPICREALPAI